jgi:hypothetical protein
MSKTLELAVNAVGRKVPLTVNGREQVPFQRRSRSVGCATA